MARSDQISQIDELPHVTNFFIEEDRMWTDERKIIEYLREING